MDYQGSKKFSNTLKDSSVYRLSTTYVKI